MNISRQVLLSSVQNTLWNLSILFPPFLFSSFLVGPGQTLLSFDAYFPSLVQPVSMVSFSEE